MAGGALLGIVVAFAIVTGVRLLALTVQALPGMAVNDPAVMNAWIADAPAYLLALYVAAWPVGAFAGGWLAARVAHSKVPVWIVTGMAVLLSSVTALTLAFPFWAQVVLIAGPLLGGWLATRLAPVRAAAPTDD
jgi:hypothetical protein